MPKPFDATIKDLITTYPADWLGPLGFPTAGPVEVIPADLSAVSAAADTLLRVGDDVVHIDVQAGPDEHLARRMLLYNVLAHHHTGLPVHSVAVLLRPNAVRAGLADRVEYAPKPAAGGLAFRFQIVRVWERPAEEWLRAGAGLVPLAVLGRPPRGRTRREALPGIVGDVVGRADRELPPPHAGHLVMAAYILAGMHMTKPEARKLFMEVQLVRESTTYQVILEEGAVEHAHRMLLALGADRYGEVSPAVETRVKRITDLPRLDRLILRVGKVDSWDALLRGR